MKHGALLALCAVAAFAVAQAGGPITSPSSVRSPPPPPPVVSATFTSFPYVQCYRPVMTYSVEPTIRSLGNGTYCLTLDAKPVPPNIITNNTAQYCQYKSDVRKIELNVNNQCDVLNPVVITTLNGVPTRVGASFFTPEPPAPPTARVLRITQLNLNNNNADGAVLCLTLGTNNNGRGCATLEQLCVPPPGMPAGTCSVALFDSKQDCCPVSRVNVPSPPPLPPRPPPPPPPPPVSEQCETCAYVTFTPRSPGPTFSLNLTQEQCNKYSSTVYTDLMAAAAAVNASIIAGSTAVDCSAQRIKMCVRFASNGDGLKLNGNLLAAKWLSFLVPKGCPAYFEGYSIAVKIASNGTDYDNPSPSSCLNGQASITCTRPVVDFPKCECATYPRATPFAAAPYLTSNLTFSANSSLYCFTVKVVTPIWPRSPCANQTTLLKAEIWGNDAPTQRRKILNVYVRAGNSNSVAKFAPSWGKKDEQTLKVSGLDWSPAEADGAEICMELRNDTDLPTFCLGGGDTCWINFFSPDKLCCPLYSASLSAL